MLANPRKYDHICYVDTGIYKVVKYVDKFFYELNATPNMITTLSIPFGLLGLYFFYRNNYWSIPIFYMYLLLDYADGYYARKHDMVTKFGDWYDHIRDSILIILLIIVIMYKVKSSKKYKVLFYSLCFILFTFGSLIVIYFACNEKKLSNNDSVSCIFRCCIKDDLFVKSDIVCLGNFLIVLAIIMYIMIKYKG